MPTAGNDVALAAKLAPTHAASAKESPAREAMGRAPMARLATRSTMDDAMGNQCCALRDNTTKKCLKKKVRFHPQMPNAVWIADSNYDRRSIVVDLSKTPFALFRKDALLMAKSSGVVAPQASAVASRASPLASTAADVASSTADVDCLSSRENSTENIELKPLVSSATRRANDTAATTATAPAAGASPSATTSSTKAASAAAGSSPSVAAAASPVLPETTETRSCSQFFGSWDSEESDSAGHTDTEDVSEHSEGCDGDAENAERRSGEPAFYGVWKRERSEGYEQLLLSSGVPKRAAAIALRKHPVHIIDHDGSYFRLIVKNGLSKVDNTFFIGDEPREVSNCVRLCFVKEFFSSSAIVQI